MRCSRNSFGGYWCLLQRCKACRHQPASTARAAGLGAKFGKVPSQTCTHQRPSTIYNPSFFRMHGVESNSNGCIVFAHIVIEFESSSNVKTAEQHPSSFVPGPFRAVGSRVLRLAGLRCRVLYPAQSNGKEAPYLSEGRRTSETVVATCNVFSFGRKRRILL